MRLNHILWLVPGLSLFLLGCGAKEEAPETAPASSSLPMPSLAAKTPPPPGSSGGPASVAAPASPDFASEDRPTAASGKPLSDLEWLNQIMEGYLMQNALPYVPLPKGKFNSPEEESAAYAAAMAKKQKSAVPADLSDLVKAGLIKRIPAAPPGKKYVFDPKSGTVVMTDQK